VAATTKRVRLMEEDYETMDTKLNQTSSKLDEATKAADESERSVRLSTKFILRLHSSFMFIYLVNFHDHVRANSLKISPIYENES
jgi:hypothetical protein